MDQLITKPVSLQSGDTVAIICSARKVSEQEIQFAVNTFETWGLHVLKGKTIGAADFQFGGSDDLRVADLQLMLEDENIKAIFIARGGYGTVRIIDRINFSSLINSPKWICGFSDVTVLHNALLNQGVASLHCAMPFSFATSDVSAIERMKQVLFGSELSYEINPQPINRSGNAKGILCGGNLSILVNQIGTATDIDTSGKILFIEDVDEHLYHLDRMMQQMKRSGKLSSLAGLVVGYLTDMKNLNPENPFGKTADQIVADAVKDFNYPVCFGFPSGHESNNQPLIIGAAVDLQVNENLVRINFIR